MTFVADLHIHSHYSISTSPQLDPEHLELSARRKGLTVVGTGDFTHPGWRAELGEKIEPAEPGLFALKSALRLPGEAADTPVRFLLSAEVSCIYRYDGRVRKVHCVVLVPDMASADRIGLCLGRIGNVEADGRPVLALDARDLLEIVVENAPEGMLIPAHIWTPWFSALGAKSGFDSIADCFRDLREHIRAVETGLSSDPPMNGMCGALDRYTLVSNSDAHSPDRLCREGNILDTPLDYAAITRALREGAAAGFRGTLEFFPEEGKYHLDGHRSCGVRQDPGTTIESGGRCPVCGKEVTVGVLHRVLELADRPYGRRPESAPPFHSLIPLREILAEIAGTGAQSKAVSAAYDRTLASCGTELDVLLHLDVPEIERRAGELTAEAVRRMRSREVLAEAGYDGEYGTIRLFRPGEIQERSQSFLLPGISAPATRPRAARERLLAVRDAAQPELFASPAHEPGSAFDLSPEQREAALHGSGPALVIAGPGTGKTRTLTWRAAHLVRDLGIEPCRVLIVTFTNKAAGEIRERLTRLLDPDAARLLFTGTFHAFGLRLLTEHAGRWGRTPDFALYDDQDRKELLGASAAGRLEAISAVKRGARRADQEERDLLAAYEAALRGRNAFDLDDLVLLPTTILGSIAHGIEWLLVDELQDLDAAQYAMVRALLPDPGANLFAIGDPDQAIYGFRGGDPALSRKLLEDYPTTRTYTLRTSHRCPRTVLRASRRVLRGPEDRRLEGVGPGVRVRVTSTGTERSEAEMIARIIEDMMGGLRFFSMDSAVTEGTAAPEVQGLGDFAVLVRMARLAAPIRAAFDDHAIPYQTAGERSFLTEEPCRSILAVLSLSADPGDQATARRLAGRERLRIVRGGLEGLVALLVAEHGVGAKIRRAAEALDARDRGEGTEIENLVEMAEPFGADLRGFIRSSRLGSPADGVRPGAERVSLLTLHAAKGLEFSCVFIAGCEEGIIPLALDAFGYRADPEEERRLLYVGMTRARRLLILTHAARRRLFGRTLSLPRSRFLADLDEESFEETAQEMTRRGPRERQLDLGLS